MLVLLDVLVIVILLNSLSLMVELNCIFSSKKRIGASTVDDRIVYPSLEGFEIHK